MNIIINKKRVVLIVQAYMHIVIILIKWEHI